MLSGLGLFVRGDVGEDAVQGGDFAVVRVADGDALADPVDRVVGPEDAVFHLHGMAVADADAALVPQRAVFGVDGGAPGEQALEQRVAADAEHLRGGGRDEAEDPLAVL